jgi:citrate lyase beta subunit
MRARRALLYMPGDDMHKIRKAATLGVDCVCLDMEDGVAQNRKADARKTIVEALGSLNFGGSERLARINPVGSGLEEDDLLAVLPSRPDGIVVPKVEQAGQVRWVCAQIEKAEGLSKLERESIGLIVIIETARGIVNLAQIASADPRLKALIFGAEDFAGDMGAVRTPEAWEVFYARSAVVTHAAAFDLQAIDMVYVDFKDMEGLRQEARRAVQMGFAGKQIIHPNQVVPVQQAFTPSDEEIRHAQRIMDAFAEHQQAGRGAFALDGKMIDAPILKTAQRVLARAHAAGKTQANNQ